MNWPWKARVARAAGLVRNALGTLVHEGPRAWGTRQWLWMRKRWFYAAGRPRAVRSLNTGELHAAPLAARQPLMRGASTPLRVCYIASIEELVSKRYRVDHMIERLRLAGARASAIYEIDALAHADEALASDLLIVQRVPASAELRALLALARARRIALAFDADDYVFEPAVEPSVAALRDAAPAKVAEWRHIVAGCRESLLLCDAFIGSTAFLARQAEDLGRPAFVLPNGVSQRQVDLAERAIARREASRQHQSAANGKPLVRIGYLAGTATHQRDFPLVVNALARILHEQPEVRVELRGLVPLAPELAPFAARVARRPFVSWERLVAATARLDLCLAPLELDNPFTEGKSALKYVESGLVAVPVIASATDEYRAAIQPGTTGLLATTSDDWYAGLRQLTGDAVMRRALGAAARQDVLARYTPRAQAARTLAVCEEIVRRVAGSSPALG